MSVPAKQIDLTEMETRLEYLHAIRADIARTMMRASVKGLAPDPIEIRALVRAERIARINLRRVMRGKSALLN